MRLKFTAFHHEALLRFLFYQKVNSFTNYVFFSPTVFMCIYVNGNALKNPVFKLNG